MSPHRDSPIEVVVRAAGCDPQQSEAFGGGLAGGNLREACTFAVRARDKWGHPCDPMSKPVPRWRASTAHEAAWPVRPIKLLGRGWPHLSAAPRILWRW